MRHASSEPGGVRKALRGRTLNGRTYDEMPRIAQARRDAGFMIARSAAASTPP